MVFVFAAIGLVSGFVVGLFVINLFLRHYSSSELVKNKSLRWSYGVAVWVFAGLGAWGGVVLHGRIFI